jgi:hypothetical protein
LKGGRGSGNLDTVQPDRYRRPGLVRGEFGFIFRAAPAALQGTLAALETHDAALAALVLDRFQFGGDDDAALEHAEALRAVLAPARLADSGVLRFPVRNATHRFVFQPGNPDLRPLLDGSMDAQAFKTAIMSGVSLSLNELSDTVAPETQSPLVTSSFIDSRQRG